MDSNDSQLPRPSGLPNSSGSGSGSGSGLETLIRFDELSPAELAELKTTPSAARAIDLMESAEAYLESGGLAEASVSAEELYAYGLGPGASALESERQAAVKRHLSASPEESAWVEGLQAAPPSPLILDHDSNEEASEDQPALSAQAQPGKHLRAVASDAFATATAPSPTAAPPVPTQRPAPTGVNWMVWSPLAAAALVLAMALGGGARPSALDGALPDSPILRSSIELRLLFPRGRILSANAPSGAFAARPRFEITPSTEASLFRYELKRLDPIASMDAGSALFEAGESLWTVESKKRTITANPLETGAYEWTAWETINGVDRRLGTMTFQVVEDPAWNAATLQAEGATETVIRERVRQLHADGYLTDARNLVRALPTSSERSSYLTGQ